jgi:undecaprenyl diphosphate synthase
VRAARRLGIRGLTLYAFSEQNWERPEPEVRALMSLLREFLITERSEIMDNEIRLRTIGKTDRLPPDVREVLDPLIEESADHRGMNLVLALSYGGREEIVDVARRFAEDVSRGDIDPGDIDLAAFDAALPSAMNGPVDLLIRTGGEMRTSNFLPWGAAYAELYFSDLLWPDFGKADFYEAVAEYQRRNRRFGRVESLPAEPAIASAPALSAQAVDPKNAAG